MSLRTALIKRLDATLIVAISTSLAIWSANHFERSGPDHALLEQLKQMQESRLERDANAEFRQALVGQRNAPTPNLDEVAQR